MKWNVQVESCVKKMITKNKVTRVRSTDQLMPAVSSWEVFLQQNQIQNQFRIKSVQNIKKFQQKSLSLYLEMFLIENEKVKLEVT